ncbi:sarcosine oxidase subunit delta [Sedimentitalea nanhaiensis]|uniref:Sarcosine oxidase subunit alpha/sarcosine oxidase subunit delta n=1 Tax=Sedimentitalea nanhaiensis TaxID=999627 RepID=A0A1I7DZ78_9RHOB|nr:sarcosine oxidase subunit delta [Sedimentitalea nanhaiensis]SFU16945.1 sarcosine oxidase subunit alpha/sarcosine oxidase subunit delta [Sedimentitalea nanhaiensis]
MLLIPCPFCGPRNESEFAHGGPVRARRPDPDAVSDAAWVEYLTVTPNPQGPVQEHWWHVRGCGTWLTLWRDTTSHDIVKGPDDA